MVLAALLFFAAPTSAQTIDWYGECPEPGFGATCDEDDSVPRARPGDAAIEHDCEYTDPDGIQTEYHRAVGAFVQLSAEEDLLNAMLWLARVQNLQAHWDDWYYWCSGEHYSMRPQLPITLDDELAEQFAVEYEKFYPRSYSEPADIITGPG